MRQQHPETIIFSAERSTLSDEENYNKTDTLERYLKSKNIPFKRVQGVYKGSHETAFVVNAVHLETLKSVIFKVFEQESYLHLDNERSASLVFADGSRQDIGRFKATSKERALQADGYTYDKTTGIYYICE